MIQVKVEYFVPLSHFFGKREDVLQFDPRDSVTVDSVLDCIGEKYEGKTGKLVLRLKEASQYVVLLNGQKIPSYDTRLVDGDVVRIMVPLAGG